MAARNLRFRLSLSHRIVRYSLHRVMHPIIQLHTGRQSFALPARSANALTSPSYVQSAGPACRLQCRSVEDVGGANRSKRPISNGVARRRARRSALDTRSSGLEHSSDGRGSRQRQKTSPAAGHLWAVATRWIATQDPRATVAFFPSDHFIREEGAFIEQVGRSVHHAQDGRTRWYP